MLKAAIRDFDGTVIVVSHDREFLDGLVTSVYEFGGGQVRHHIGGIYDFLQSRQIENLNELQKTQPQAAAAPAAATADESASAGKLSYEQQKAQARQRRKLEQAVSEAEQTVIDLETKLHDLEQLLATPEGAADAARCEEYGRLQAEKADAEQKWEEAMEALEQFGEA